VAGSSLAVTSKVRVTLLSGESARSQTVNIRQFGQVGTPSRVEFEPLWFSDLNLPRLDSFLNWIARMLRTLTGDAKDAVRKAGGIRYVHNILAKRSPIFAAFLYSLPTKQ
jgi:hypothetical protein